MRRGFHRSERARLCGGRPACSTATVPRRTGARWISSPYFGTIPTHQRVVIDRKRMTNGGVTAGINFGLTLAGLLCGEDYARQVEPRLEYAPPPPFGCGFPKHGPAELVAAMRELGARAITLGPRILRAETAAVASVAMAMTLWGDL